MRIPAIFLFLGSFLAGIAGGSIPTASASEPPSGPAGGHAARLRADDGPIAGRFTLHAHFLDSLDAVVRIPGPGRVLALEFRDANGEDSFVIPGDLALKDLEGREWRRGFLALGPDRLAGLLPRATSRWALWWVPLGVDSLEWTAPADLTLWYGFTKETFVPLRAPERAGIEAAIPWPLVRDAEIDPSRAASDLGPAVDPAAFDQPPLVLERVEPVYPKSLRAYGYEGSVTTVAMVSAEGRVTDAFVLGSTATHDLNASALAAVMRWKFRPGVKNGDSVAGPMVIPIRFALGSVK